MARANIVVGIAARDEGPALEETIRSVSETANGLVSRMVIIDDASRDLVAGRIAAMGGAPFPINVYRNAVPQGAGPSKHILASRAGLLSGEVLVILDAHVLMPDLWALEAQEACGAGMVFGWPVRSMTGAVPDFFGVRVDGLNADYGPVAQQRFGHIHDKASGPHGGMLAIGFNELARLGGYCPLLVGFGCEEPWLALRMAAEGIPFCLSGDFVKHWFMEDKPERPVEMDDGRTREQTWTNLANMLLIVCAVSKGEWLDHRLEKMRRGMQDRFGEGVWNRAVAYAYKHPELPAWRAWFRHFERVNRLCDLGLVGRKEMEP